MTISVIILTFNSEATIASTLDSAGEISDDIHVVDSYSTDKTLEIAKSFCVHVVQHEFENYGHQRNWAIDNLPLKHGWELHLDADEKLTKKLIKELTVLRNDFPDDISGYFIPRLVQFLDRPIRHGGMYPIWHLRLFRRGVGRCEDRSYDQHFFVTSGKTSKLSNPMIDDNKMELSNWVSRHNRWADAEADEVMCPTETGVVSGEISGNPIQKKRALRGSYYQSPMFFRAFLLFFYRYIIRFGFLDGKEGLVFFVLQTFWFRFLIDAKLFERKYIRQKGKDDVEAST